MNRLLLAAMALLPVATTASAADLQARPYTKAPPPVVSPAYNWSGFYIGAMGGGASNDTGNGGFGGGTVGYNWQFPGGDAVLDAGGGGVDFDTEDELAPKTLTAS
jgi:outer membrane immunogenic protein